MTSPVSAAKVIALAALLLAMGGMARGAETAWTRLEREFRELPPEAQRLTGPLFWLHGDESRERLELHLAKVKEGGNGTFTAESRPHSDWLGEGWFRDLKICLDAARKHDLTMWIFDERWWPSQEVGGRVPPEYGCKILQATANPVYGPLTLHEDGFGTNTIAVIAGKTVAGGIDGRTLLDLTLQVKDGTLTWDVPTGAWTVMGFSWAFEDPKARKGSQTQTVLVDGLSPDCVEWYLQTVYQPHHDRFGDDFGKTIRGFFYDEPETRGDWGPQVMKVLAERKVDWMKALVAWKFQLAGEDQAAAKFQYQDALAEAWGRTMYGGIAKWCREHRVRSMGHFMEHGYLYVSPDFCAGNMMHLQKYSDMGGIDLVCSQMHPGQRPRDIYQTPKLGSSITHAYGKRDDITMCEMFGAYGQDITYPEMKWLTDQMQVRGVNFMIPHSFNPRAPNDTDCPPYFYMDSEECRWPLYRVYGDYTSRLSLLLSCGRHVCPVALLFAGTSVHAGKAVTPEDMTSALQDALYDCDWLPYEVFERDAALKKKQIYLREERYRVLIVPPVEVIPYATLEKVRSFFDQGGIVIGYGFLPTKSATLGRKSSEIARVCEAVWGNGDPGLAMRKTSYAGGRSYLLPESPTPDELYKVLAEDAGVHPALEVVEGETNHWLHVLHRVKDGCDVFLVCNQNHEGPRREFRFKVTASGEPEWWDAMRNEITAPKHNRVAPDSVEIDLALEPGESALLVFRKEKRPLPYRLDGNVERAGDSIPIVREGGATGSPKPDGGDTLSLEGCPWVWFPEYEPTVAATPGKRYFRGGVTIPSDRTVKEAHFLLTADNRFVLWVNGRVAGQNEGGMSWRTLRDIDMTQYVRPGVNQFAIVAENEEEKPNPAGLIGRYAIDLDDGRRLVGQIDGTWRTSTREEPGWEIAGFYDGDWAKASEAARYGDPPWMRLSTHPGMTVSPATADPFVGKCTIQSGVNLSRFRVFLEMEMLAPEAAAAVTINGRYAGGFIGKPFRLDVTNYVKNGENRIVIEPFAPGAAWLAVYE